MYTTTVYETHNIVLPAAKYTVISHSPEYTQLLRHKLSTDTETETETETTPAPPKFAVNIPTIVKPRERSVLITRQYRLLNSRRLEITHVVTKHELDHFEIEWQNKDEYTCELADDSEETKLMGIREYGDEERERDVRLAKDAGIFYLALLAMQKEVQDREDADEWVVVKRDGMFIVPVGLVQFSDVTMGWTCIDSPAYSLADWEMKLN